MSEPKFRPLFLIKPKSVSPKDIRRVERMCGICMVECADPESARYSDPPIGGDIDEQSRAALGMLRMVMRSPGNVLLNKHDLLHWFVNEIVSSNKPLAVSVTKNVKS